MIELIKIKIVEDIQIVSARELYLFLGLDRSNWKRWYVTNISNNPFAIEYQDFTETLVIERNGSEVVDFDITLDFAKRLSMLARTEKGEEVRKYFLDCEKKVQELQKSQYVIPQTYADALFLAANQQLQIQEQQTLLIEQAPKVEFVDKLIETKDAFTTISIASEYGMTAYKLNKLLGNLKVQYYQDNQWILYAEHKAKGYTKTRTTLFNDDSRSSHLTVWTEKGRLFIHGLLKELDYKTV